MNTRTSVRLLLLFAFIFFNSCNRGTGDKTDYSYLYHDQPSDLQFPAGIVELKFTSGGSGIYGFEYMANHAGPHPTVVLVHANPGNERNLDIAQALRRAGYNVFYFDYRGSWGSEGTYSYANCIADTRAVIDYITSDENRERLRVDSSRIYLIGHNLGAGIGMIEGLRDPRVKAVAAISLVNPYTIFKGKDARLNFMDMKEYFSTLGMLRSDPQTFLSGIVRDIEQYNIEKMIAATSKPVLVMDEHHNNNFLENYNHKKKVDYEIWDTDLEFSDARITLTKKLKNWLDSCQVVKN